MENIEVRGALDDFNIPGIKSYCLLDFECLGFQKFYLGVFHNFLAWVLD